MVSYVFLNPWKKVPAPLAERPISLASPEGVVVSSAIVQK